MNEAKIQPIKGLHFSMEDGKPVLKNVVYDVEVTISFAEAEPARNAKEACLSIISRQYCEKITETEGKCL